MTNGTCAASVSPSVSVVVSVSVGSELSEPEDFV